MAESGAKTGLYLRQTERWRRWGELHVLVLVGVSYIQDKRNHVVLPRLHFHGYCGLRCAHFYPQHKNSISLLKAHAASKKVATESVHS